MAWYGRDSGSDNHNSSNKKTKIHNTTQQCSHCIRSVHGLAAMEKKGSSVCLVGWCHKVCMLVRWVMLRRV